LGVPLALGCHCHCYDPLFRGGYVPLIRSMSFNQGFVGRLPAVISSFIVFPGICSIYFANCVWPCREPYLRIIVSTSSFCHTLSYLLHGLWIRRFAAAVVRFSFHSIGCIIRWCCDRPVYLEGPFTKSTYHTFVFSCAIPVAPRGVALHYVFCLTGWHTMSYHNSDDKVNEVLVSKTFFYV
jgi:hypothetical protein